MPNTDLFDRAEGYGHTAGTQASKDDGNWSALPSVPEDNKESTNDRLFRAVDAKHADAGPGDYDADSFIGDTPFDEYRRHASPEWDEGGHALVMDGPRPAITYEGTNPRLDVQSTEAAVFNRPVNGWDHDDEFGDQAKGDGLMNAEEHAGYRKADGTFANELDDPNDSDEVSAAKPAIATLAPAAQYSNQPDDVLEDEDDLGANLDPED